MEFRPSNLDELFGQDHLKPILTKWLSDPKQIPQSILLHGPYGMGKTSIARILAKQLVGDESDIMEMNAAASRGIDDIRDVADSVVFSGLSGNKVYIIDELHQLTQAAQSALLKVIEEPREGIYFILCTTEFSKLLDTIRSRCTKLEVRLLEEEDAFRLMNLLAPQMDNDLKMDIFYSSGGHARDIVKAINVGLSNPQVIVNQVQNIHNAYQIIADWFQAKEGVDCSPLFNLDDQAIRNLCDHICNNPAYLGAWYNFKNYTELLNMRAHSLLYLITQKQRLNHLIMVRYQ